MASRIVRNFAPSPAPNPQVSATSRLRAIIMSRVKKVEKIVATATATEYG